MNGTDTLRAQVEFPVVVKFTFGNWGLGVYICEDMKQMNAAIQAQHNGPYILQVW